MNKLQTVDRDDPRKAADLIKGAQSRPFASPEAVASRQAKNKAIAQSFETPTPVTGDISLFKDAQQNGARSLHHFDEIDLGKREGKITSLDNPMLQVTDATGAAHSIVGTILHARLHSADELSRTVQADLDESDGLKYHQSKKHFSRLLNVHGPASHDEDGNRVAGKHVARITAIKHDEKAKRVRMSLHFHDEDGWQSLKGGHLTHLTLKTKPGSSGGQKPIRATLSKPPGHAVKSLDFRQTDGTMIKVDVSPQHSNAIGKADGSHDVFKGIMSRPERRGW